MNYIYMILFILFMNNSLLLAREMPQQYQIHSGVLRKDATGDFIVEKETMDIPLIYESENPNYYYGFTLEEKNHKTFNCQIVIEMPTPQVIMNHSKEGYMGEQNRSNVGQRTVWSSDKAKKDGYLYGAFKFTAGDKEGLYRVKILINDKLEQILDFNVKRYAGNNNLTNLREGR